MSRSWAAGSTRRWRRIRAGVLAENQRTRGGVCGVQLDGVCTGVADTVHHILGRAVTGDDPKHLIACCRACNLKIGEPNRHNPKPRRVSSW